MLNSLPMTIGAIDAARPVFQMIMGICIVIFTIRLAALSADWPARLMVTGSLLLGFGYAVLLPGLDSGVIPGPATLLPHDPAVALAWQAVKVLTMNLGWLTFGLGIAMHARVLPAPRTVKAKAKPTAATQPETLPAPARQG